MLRSCYKPNTIHDPDDDVVDDYVNIWLLHGTEPYVFAGLSKWMDGLWNVQTDRPLHMAELNSGHRHLHFNIC